GTGRKREFVGRKSAVAGAARVEAADHLAIHQHVEGLAAIDGALRGLEGERIGAGTEGDRLAEGGASPLHEGDLDAFRGRGVAGGEVAACGRPRPPHSSYYREGGRQ